MKVLTWDQKRARLLASLAPLDTGAEARGDRIQESLHKAEEERLLREAALLVIAPAEVENHDLDPVALPDFDNEISEIPALAPTRPDPEPVARVTDEDFLEGDLPDADLPTPSSSAGKKTGDQADDIPPILLLED